MEQAPIGRRLDAAIISDYGENLYMFGSTPDDFSTLWRYNLCTRQWTVAPIAQAAHNYPPIYLPDEQQHLPDQHDPIFDTHMERERNNSYVCGLCHENAVFFLSWRALFVASCDSSALDECRFYLTSLAIDSATFAPEQRQLDVLDTDGTLAIHCESFGDRGAMLALDPEHFYVLVNNFEQATTMHENGEQSAEFCAPHIFELKATDDKNQWSWACISNGANQALKSNADLRSTVHSFMWGPSYQCFIFGGKHIAFLHSRTVDERPLALDKMLLFDVEHCVYSEMALQPAVSTDGVAEYPVGCVNTRLAIWRRQAKNTTLVVCWPTVAAQKCEGVLWALSLEANNAQWMRMGLSRRGDSRPLPAQLYNSSFQIVQSAICIFGGEKEGLLVHRCLCCGE